MFASKKITSDQNCDHVRLNYVVSDFLIVVFDCDVQYLSNTLQ